jgi:glyoxylase-like metal-dependent hydrolase (beta-lactamase superfamily II)
MSTKASATIRMYRLNELGDCFLIAFTAGGATSRMLIDCGSFRNSDASITRLEKIVTGIRDDLSGAPLDVVVGTHQHNDHLSGFVHCEKTFRAIGVEQVWLSWLDNPADSIARGIGEDHNNLMMSLFEVRKQFRTGTRGARGARTLEVVDDILGFYGARGTKTPPELPADAVKILKKIGRKEPKYLRPGRVLDMPGLPAGSVRIYVLGPPRKKDLLYDKDPNTGQSYDHALAAASVAANKFLDAVTRSRGGEVSSEEDQYPFGEAYKRRGAALNSPRLKEIRKRYRARDEAWRKIDDDWMNQAKSLALFLDQFTNNSSLVLAIELVDSGKVLLFVADAQTGNWLSWPDVKWEKEGVRTDDLLARTVFYKVGHHASHNATLVPAFEKMTNPRLVALIPVHKKDPNITKKNGWKMPAKNLFKQLVARTSNRVLQMDGVNPPDCDPRRDPAKRSWRLAGITPRVTDMFVELEFSGE